MITERLLQFLWQMQYFNKEDLLTEAGENLRIIHPGQHNSNQGPDFINARIKIQDTEWIGNVELHTLSSLWLQHGHHLDPNYSNVILHVVWEDDAMISGIPVLVLQHRIPKLILQRYEEWMRTPRPIPCSGLIGQTTDLVWKSWKERLLVERMIRKSSLVSGFLEENKGNWEETFWWLIARNFGIKVNEDAFEEMARTLPLNLLTRHKDQVIQLESMLMGQAGLLEKKFLEPYPRALQEEYRFYQKKYTLHPIRQPVHFLRMRPGNFPTLRLAQLAMLLHQSKHLFTRVREARQVKEVKSMLELKTSAYWDRHYVFDELSSNSKKKLGKEMISNILINSILPALFSYGHLNKEEALMKTSLDWMESIDVEHNSLLELWKNFGITASNAFDSQALLELRTRYCNPKRCLDCAVGNNLFKKQLDP